MSPPDTDSHEFVPDHKDSHLRGWLIIAAVLWAASLFGAWTLASRRAEPSLGAVSGELVDSGKQLREQKRLVDQLRQEVATLKRSDQISRNANAELQSTLAEREEEVSGLRADVDFYNAWSVRPASARACACTRPVSRPRAAGPGTTR